MALRTGFLPSSGNVLGVASNRPFYRTQVYPAPFKGINAVDPLQALNPVTDCVISSNLIPDGRGMRVRSGYVEFARLTGAAGVEVRTVIPFAGSTLAAAKLFVTTATGFYDVTAGGTLAGPANPLFGTVDTASGFGTWTNYVVDNGSHYSFYADETNGLYRYQQGGAWAVPGDITGVAMASIAFVMQFKGRIWMVEKNTGRAWYLPTGAIAGAATRFDFGNKFKYGGELVGLWSWTIDGGAGMDDNLVAVSAGGDVMVYKGIDPASATTWGSIGQYFIGPPPAGRRLASNFGGELFLLSQYGVLPMSSLIAGRPIDKDDTYASRNIGPLLTNDMNLYRTQRGWEIRNVPSENVFLISVPKQLGLSYKQYARSSKTSGWGIFNSLPYTTGETFQGGFYIGAPDATGVAASGIVYKFTGNLEGVTLAGGYTPIAVQFSLLTAFSDLGEPGTYHQLSFVRPVFRSSAIPNYGVIARFDYNTDDLVISTGAGAAVGALWDSALWDTALWGQDASTVESVIGGYGVGRAMALGLTGSSTGETTLIRMDSIYTSGGPL
jgi:hypothetical protein